MSFEQLFFDLDGTLVDPAEGITRCIRHALDRLDHPSPDDDVLHGWIGPPLRQSFAGLLGESRADEGVRLYRERYTEVGIREFTVYPGVPDTLAALSERGLSLAVATSKPSIYARQVLSFAALDDCFDAVYGAELDGRHSDKTALLRFARLSSGGRAAAMIGDRRFDIEGAQGNGLAAIGVLWGYGSRKELAGADALVATPADIPDAVGKIYSNKIQRIKR